MKLRFQFLILLLMSTLVGACSGTGEAPETNKSVEEILAEIRSTAPVEASDAPGD